MSASTGTDMSSCFDNDNQRLEVPFLRLVSPLSLLSLANTLLVCQNQQGLIEHWIANVLAFV